MTVSLTSKSVAAQVKTMSGEAISTVWSYIAIHYNMKSTKVQNPRRITRIKPITRVYWLRLAV